MEIPKRDKLKTPPEDMVWVKRDYLKAICDNSNINLIDLSLKMGYNRLYLPTAIYDGRMNKDHLRMLSYMLMFDYKDALARKPRSKKSKNY